MTQPVITTQLSTISTDGPKSSEASDAPASAPPDAVAINGAPAAPEEAGTSPEPSPQGPDKNLELAKRFESIAKREARVRKFETEAQSSLSRIAEKEAALDARLKKMEMFEADPVSYLLDEGKDPVEFVKRAAKPLSEEERRLKKIEERLEAREKQEAEQKKDWEQRQEGQRRFHAMKGFVSSITRDDCPNVTTLYEPHEVPKLVEELLNRKAHPKAPTLLDAFVEEHGRNPSDKEIRECLEFEADLRATRLIESRKAKLAAPTESAPPQDGTTDSGPSGISNQHAALSSTGKKRPATADERRRQARKELTEQLEAEAAARSG